MRSALKNKAVDSQWKSEEEGGELGVVKRINKQLRSQKLGESLFLRWDLNNSNIVSLQNYAEVESNRAMHLGLC